MKQSDLRRWAIVIPVAVHGVGSFKRWIAPSALLGHFDVDLEAVVHRAALLLDRQSSLFNSLVLYEAESLVDRTTFRGEIILIPSMIKITIEKEKKQAFQKYILFYVLNHY